MLKKIFDFQKLLILTSISSYTKKETRKQNIILPIAIIISCFIPLFFREFSYNFFCIYVANIIFAVYPIIIEKDHFISLLPIQKHFIILNLFLFGVFLCAIVSSLFIGVILINNIFVTVGFFISNIEGIQYGVPNFFILITQILITSSFFIIFYCGILTTLFIKNNIVRIVSILSFSCGFYFSVYFIIKLIPVDPQNSYALLEYLIKNIPYGWAYLLLFFLVALLFVPLGITIANKFSKEKSKE